jgi:Uma2 family endonuclease
MEVWNGMSADERRRVVSELPAEVPWDLHPPEGDSHRRPKERAVDALGRFFRRAGRRVYVSSELATYYPGEARFSPDVLVVFDVDDHDREKWVVADEGKGLDFVLEIHVGGDRKKDFEKNVERYARLGIPEYFIYDRPAHKLTGFRLAGPRYKPVVPQAGRYGSTILGLELTLEQGRLRFLCGQAVVLETDDLIAMLERTVDELVASREAAEQRAEQEAQRAEKEAQRAEHEAQRATAAEQRLAEALAELERLRGR